MTYRRLGLPWLIGSLLALGLSGFATAADPTAPATGGPGSPSKVEPASPGMSPQPSMSGPTSPGTTAAPDLGTTEGIPLAGLDVVNSEGEQLGTVDSVLVDEHGLVTHVILGTGGVLGLGEDRYKIPWKHVSVRPGTDHLVVDVKKSDIESEFSAFEPNSPPESMSGKSPENAGDQPSPTDPAR